MRGTNPSTHDGGEALDDLAGTRQILRYLCDWLGLDVDITAEAVARYAER